MSTVRLRLGEAIQAAARIESGDDPSHSFTGLNLEKEWQAEKEDEGIFSVLFSPNGQQMFVGSGSEGVKRIDLQTGKMTVLKHTGKCELSVNCLKLHPVDYATLFAATTAGKVLHLAIDRAEVTVLAIEKGNQLSALDISASGNQMVTVGSDCAVRLYDCSGVLNVHITRTFSGYRAHDFDSPQGHSMRLYSTRFHPEQESLFLTAGWDNIVKIWDARLADPTPVANIAGPHICAPDGLDVSGNFVLTASWISRDALQLWDLRNLTDGPIASPRFCADASDHEMLYAGRLAHHGVALAASSATHSVRAIHLSSGQILGELVLPSAVYALDSTLGGRRFAAASKDGSVVLGYLH